MSNFSKKCISSVLFSAFAATANADSASSIAQSFDQAGRDILALVLDSSTKVANVLDHGCWCKKMDPSITDVSMLGGKDPVDPLDQICKQWFTARRCNGNLEGGSCVNYPEGGFYKLNSKMECASGKNDDCEEDTCQIDMHFANSIEDYLNGNPSWAPDSSQACPIGSGDGGATHYCAGVAPFVYITSEEPTEAPPTDPPSCSDNEIDITFLVDGSSSIEDADWNKAVDFLGTLLAGLDIGEQKN